VWSLRQGYSTCSSQPKSVDLDSRGGSISSTVLEPQAGEPLQPHGRDCEACKLTTKATSGQTLGEKLEYARAYTVPVSPTTPTSSQDARLRLFTLEHHQQVNLPTRNIVTRSTDSVATIDFIRNKILECDTRHAQCCDADSAASYPTRLVRVSENNGTYTVKIFVVTKNEAPPRYAALSYCWGQIRPTCMLTTSVPDAVEKGVEWDTIPKTLQDAITCAARLGIEFLWIDCLCIIQGDRDDWAREEGA
jgi:hypothetical protein